MQMPHFAVRGILLSTAVSAFAGAPSDRAEHRFETRLSRQDDRIDRGIEAGRIGPREAQVLNRQQMSLDRALDRQSADGGRLSAREAYRLENRFDHSSRAIRAAWARPRG